MKNRNTDQQLQGHMSVGEHIVELRKRVIYILILFLLSVCLGLVLADDVVHYLKDQPAAAEIPWVVIGITDALKVYFQFAIVVGIVISFPFVLYQVWAFVSPGLTKKERRITLLYIPGAVLLFAIGLAFSYFLLFPFVINFMMSLSDRLDAQEMYGMMHYFQFLFTIVVPFGFVFQMPLLIVFLTRLGVISTAFLRRVRKYAYFILLVIAAVITPPDIFSHLLVTVPLILLYEISIWLAKLAERRKVPSSINAEEKG